MLCTTGIVLQLARRAAGVDQAGAEGAHHGGQSLQLLVLLLARRRTGAHHLLRQGIACRAAEGLLSGRGPHLKALVPLQVAPQEREWSTHFPEADWEATLQCRMACHPAGSLGPLTTAAAHQLHGQVVRSSTALVSGLGSTWCRLKPSGWRQQGCKWLLQADLAHAVALAGQQGCPCCLPL